MNGEANIGRAIAATAALIFAPIFGAIALGALQYGIYRLLAALGVGKRETIPMFPVLMLRGLLLMLAIIAAGVFYFKFGQSEPTNDGDPQHTAG